jgi:hypothetical protein
MQLLIENNLEFLVGGAYAIAQYTGIARDWAQRQCAANEKLTHNMTFPDNFYRLIRIR